MGQYAITFARSARRELEALDAKVRQQPATIVIELPVCVVAFNSQPDRFFELEKTNPSGNVQPATVFKFPILTR